MKSLKTVQTVSKVLKILTTIAFVCSIVGCALSAISIPIVAVFGNDPAIMEIMFEYGIEVDSRRMLCDCVCAVVVCAASIALYFYTMRFYKNELAIGTPFDKKVVKGMRTIAILHLAIPFGVTIITSIISVCFRVTDTSVGYISGIMLGVVYFVVAAVLNYGADLREKIDLPTDEAKPVEEDKISEGESA